MRTIWKYPVEMGEFKVEMPRNASVLTVQMQNGAPVMWVLVDTTQPKTTVTFYIAGTGHAVVDDQALYVGTFQTPPFVWHLFQR